MGSEPREVRMMAGADGDKAFRDQLCQMMRGGMAFTSVADALADFPTDKRGISAKGVPYTPWQLLEHMRIAQWDILEFSRNPRHESPDWPDGYWPDDRAPAAADAWDRSVRTLLDDLKALQDLVRDPHNDLHAPLPHGDGQTLAREALLAAHHTAYHLGQFILLRRLLGCWPPRK
ncbi:MAG TPA: DinB family protein [Candidatus Sumerlaeota bacterium]|nr:DinB family protein [Candidatus Sumerlaeota bacterium]